MISLSTDQDVDFQTILTQEDFDPKENSSNFLGEKFQDLHTVVTFSFHTCH